MPSPTPLEVPLHGCICSCALYTLPDALPHPSFVLNKRGWSNCQHLGDPRSPVSAVVGRDDLHVGGPALDSPQSWGSLTQEGGAISSLPTLDQPQVWLLREQVEAGCLSQLYRPSWKQGWDPPLPVTGQSSWDSSIGARKGARTL